MLEPKVVFPLTEIVEESVPARVMEFDAESVFPFVIDNVPVEAVSVSPLMLVAVATPRVGVVKVNDDANFAVVTAPALIVAVVTASEDAV